MEINKTFNQLEKGFNIAGSIPVVALFSSALRIAVSKIQMLASAVFGLMGLIGQMFSADRKWEDMTHSAKEQIIHGAINFIRGCGEFLLALTIVGSLGLLAYQGFSENKFEPIIKYNEPQVQAALQQNAAENV